MKKRPVLLALTPLLLLLVATPSFVQGQQSGTNSSGQQPDLSDIVVTGSQYVPPSPIYQNTYQMPPFGFAPLEPDQPVQSMPPAANAAADDAMVPAESIIVTGRRKKAKKAKSAWPQVEAVDFRPFTVDRAEENNPPPPPPPNPGPVTCF